MTDSHTHDALVLPEDAGYHDATTFVGIPGVYAPGVPVALATIGLSADEAGDRIASLGVPLEFATLDGAEVPPVPDANPPRHEGNLGFGEVAPGVRAVDVPEAAIIDGQDATPPAARPLTKAELVDAGNALGLELTERQSRDELVAAVEGAGGASVHPPEPPTTDGNPA